MHQIHAIAELRHFGHKPWCLGKVDTSEHQERTCRKYHTVYSTESPSYFYHGSFKNLSRYGLDIGRIDGQCSAYNHQYSSDDETFGTVPRKVHTYVVCQHEISQIAREVLQHMIFVPETLSPNLTKPSVEIGHAGNNLSILSKCVRCVSSILNPLDFIALKKVSICHLFVLKLVLFPVCYTTH